MPFEDALDDTVLLGDGTLVAALEVAPVDTALMSVEEVQAHLARYWQGVRGVQFPASVYVGARRQEVAGYLEVVMRRLDGLAEGPGQQRGFFGMLLEEQCRLLQVLLAEHLRSRYALLAVAHNPNSALKGVARMLVGERRRAPVSAERMREARDELELELKKVEDVLRHVGLKYERCSGRRLAAEVQRLGRPDLMAEDVAKLEASLELPLVVRASQLSQAPQPSPEANGQGVKVQRVRASEQAPDQSQSVKVSEQEASVSSEPPTMTSGIVRPGEGHEGERPGTGSRPSRETPRSEGLGVAAEREDLEKGEHYEVAFSGQEGNLGDE